ncbi:UDP-N-acetylglucosamine 1-carboxyvinyltransferase [Parelusimicrobium proximum]|uniref:UDP-N-acetylglucosamine 1-carboxyvinyltransferase n=1 Tax=Parelusimicrobium proximum TaxID=3228953 RepID=UPI003D1624F5
MDRFIIDGNTQLKGEVCISGSKNASLPILMATLLTDERCIIHNVPDLRDVRTTFKILEHLGKQVEYSNNTAVISYKEPLKHGLPYELVKQMRASFWVAGPLLARFKHAQIPLPGGCAIGVRPVDIHVKGFERLGAVDFTDKGDIILKAQELKGAKIVFRFPSVGATINLLMCASLIEGETKLENVAKEPEVYDVIEVLSKMGAEISESGSGGFIIKGKKTLSGCEHIVVADRIEAGTFMIAAAASRGDVLIKNCVPEHNDILLDALCEAGVKVEKNGTEVRVSKTDGGSLTPVSIRTMPYPGFATDLQAQWMTFLTICEGSADVSEDIFENRFMHAPELIRMGADIAIEKSIARVTGVEQLSGAGVMASDLRGGIALVMAGIIAEGQTEVDRVYHIDRGYEKIVDKLTALGAKIKRVNPVKDGEK